MFYRVLNLGVFLFLKNYCYVNYWILFKIIFLCKDYDFNNLKYYVVGIIDILYEVFLRKYIGFFYCIILIY